MTYCIWRRRVRQLEMSDTECDPVLLNTFVIGKKRYKVYFHRGTLTWETEAAPYSGCSVPLKDVLAVDYEEPSAEDPKSTSHPRYHSFVLHYTQQTSDNKWSLHSLMFNHKDSRQVASWGKTIRNYINGLSHRPRKLLLFVNPYGGNKKGLQIYEKQVKPLFSLAGVEVSLIVTQYNNHARDTLLKTDLDAVDGVACIGGDGTFAEVFNGLILRSAQDKNVDPNQSDACFPPPVLRVGVIPAGSTDTMAYCFHGTNHVPTAVLHIILGDSTGLDICSIHSGDKLLRFYSSVISYGFLGDVIKDSEGRRWMGPSRYEYSGMKKFLLNKAYKGEVTLLADSSDPTEGPRCLEQCERCQAPAVGEGEVPKLKTLNGKYFMVSGANVCCACDRSPNGISPYSHLGDGCVDVMLVKHTHWLNNLKLLLTLSSKNKNVMNLPWVEVHRVREFSFRAISQKSVWNCDGELQTETDVKIRAHCRLLKVFSRRFPERQVKATCCTP